LSGAPDKLKATMATKDSRFFIIPNMIDDAELKPSAFLLYAHLRRVCGDNRTCTEGQRLLAKRCGMSSKTVVEAKADLVKAGLIKMAEISTPHGIGHEIKLVSVKELNQAVYDKGTPSGYNCKSGASAL
jgi:Helix-turn-helix domain